MGWNKKSSNRILSETIQDQYKTPLIVIGNETTN